MIDNKILINYKMIKNSLKYININFKYTKNKLNNNLYFFI